MKKKIILETPTFTEPLGCQSLNKLESVDMKEIKIQTLYLTPDIPEKCRKLQEYSLQAPLRPPPALSLFLWCLPFASTDENVAASHSHSLSCLCIMFTALFSLISLYKHTQPEQLSPDISCEPSTGLCSHTHLLAGSFAHMLVLFSFGFGMITCTCS